jgi:mannose-6-phosphate isomerase-like protein (cupin superfamily)
MNLRWVLVCVLIGSSGVAAKGQAAGSAGLPVMKEAKVFPVEEMRSRKMPNGGESRDSIRALMATGEAVAVHESVLPVGSAPNRQHVIQHSEIITVMQGTVAFERGDKSERVETGGVIYVALGTMHTLRNVGDVPAKYVVVAIGGDVK